MGLEGARDASVPATSGQRRVRLTYAILALVPVIFFGVAFGTRAALERRAVPGWLLPAALVLGTLLTGVLVILMMRRR